MQVWIFLKFILHSQLRCLWLWDRLLIGCHVGLCYVYQMTLREYFIVICRISVEDFGVQLKAIYFWILDLLVVVNLCRLIDWSYILIIHIFKYVLIFWKISKRVGLLSLFIIKLLLYNHVSVINIYFFSYNCMIIMKFLLNSMQTFLVYIYIYAFIVLIILLNLLLLVFNIINFFIIWLQRLLLFLLFRRNSIIIRSRKFKLHTIESI